MRHPLTWTGAMSCVTLAFAIPAAAAQQDADTLYVQGQESHYEIVVSATRTPRGRCTRKVLASRSTDSISSGNLRSALSANILRSPSVGTIWSISGW